jgi:hypothetical protein
VTTPRGNGEPEASAPEREGEAPRSVEEALGRAARHARASLGEALAALRALLDAASLAASGRPADEMRGLARLAGVLDAFAEPLGRRDSGAPLLRAALEALDEEIARWEQLSREDPEARPVLRAFLGMREILWELGVRPEAPAAGAGRPASSRVQRVPVEEDGDGRVGDEPREP